MAQKHIYDALSHAVIAVFVAPGVGLALAAMIDWAQHFAGNQANLDQMWERCVEGALGGAIEAFLVAVIMTGLFET